MTTTRIGRTCTLTFAAIAAVVFGGTTAQASAAIPLNTGQETPAPSVGGAHGSFAYEIDGSELCYTIEVTDLSTPAVAAHIHVGNRNVAGPVVVPLVVPAATSFETSACATADPELLAAIEADPRAYYVNVHTSTNPPGEVRGQLK